MKLWKTLSAVFAGGLLALGASTVQGAEKTFITIGTGGLSGVYYPTGGAICRLVNKGRKDHNIRCSPESTGGSIYNINTLKAGELDFGIAQSDWHYQSYKGVGKYKAEGAYQDLRSIFSLHVEAFTIVAREDKNIKNFEDLKGKRVNIGNPGSGQRATMEMIMESYGWTKKDFKLATELKPSEMAKALCDNKIDAFVYFVGHPSGAIKEATTSCAANFVAVQGEKISKIINDHSYYTATAIPGGLYENNDADVPTFGLVATLVTSAKVSDKAAYELTKAVFSNFDEFKRLHNAFARLKKEDMIKNGLTAPIHPGAEKYFKEAGLLK